MTRSGLRKALYALRAAGYLLIDAAHGRGTSSRYRWTDGATRGRAENCPAQDTISEKVSRSGHYQEAEKCPVRGKESVPPVATNTIKEHFEDIPSPSADASPISEGRDQGGDAADASGNAGRSRKAAGPIRADMDEAFARFRAAYPKRPAPNWTKARESFDRAVKRGTATAGIIAGAEAYAAYCVREGNVGDRARFIKQPVTWLNQSEWTVDYGPVGAESGRQPTSAPLTEAQWRERLTRFQHTGAWPQAFGPRPGTSECAAPPAILAEFQIGAA